jgi:hypothetical protein
LFAAETGQALSEILYLIGDKLDTHVSTRIRYEVNRRIINSFINKRFPFEDSMSNWATVCSGSVGMTFIYMAPEKFSLIKERVRACFLNYLSGFGDDGACAEGVGYWVYGFGYYLYFEAYLENDFEEYGLNSLNEYSFLLEFGEPQSVKCRLPYLEEYARPICKERAIEVLGAI